MSTIVAGNATANGVLYGPEDFRSLILEPTINAPDLKQILTITDGIKSKEDILFAKKFRKVSHLDTGCGSVPFIPEMAVEKLSWDPKPIEAWIKECGPEFEGTFLAWGLGEGYARPDLQEAVIKIQSGIAGTDVQTMNYWNEFVQSNMEEAILDDIFRMGFFADPAITAAQLTGGADDVKNYNQIRGIWPQIIALATTYASVRAYTIAANQSADQVLPDAESRRIFRSLIVGADRRLLGGQFGQPIIMATQSIIDNWADYRETQNLETSFKLMADGIVGPKYRNITIVPRPEWDETLAADFTIGGKINLPHRAVLTTKENLQLGFDSFDKATQVKSWHNDETKFTHQRGNWKMDAKVMRPFLTRAAF
jgi:hypothetical protein